MIKRRSLFLLLALTGLLIMCIVAVLLYVKATLARPLQLVQPQLITIEDGYFAGHALRDFKANGWLDDTLPYRIALKLKPELAEIKSGTYELRPGMTFEQSITMMVNGQEKQFTVSLIEGLRWNIWLQQLRETPFLVFDIEQVSEFLEQLETPDGWTSPEGIFMPDTYAYTAGTRASELLAIAYRRLRAFLDQKWQSRALDLPYASPYEALIMASIIEKETGLASERPLIAGVFVNRLRNHMRLQTDPTVIYGLGDAFDGNLRRADLRAPTPYNTYVIKGLPPTPIAMVGKAAIEAALMPQPTDALYFVSKGDGSHYFSKTLAEHNKAVRLYQLGKQN